MPTYYDDVILYLARIMSSVDFVQFQACAREIAKECGRLPSAHEVALRMLDQHEGEAIATMQMGLYRNATFSRSSVWISEGEYEKGVRFLLRTLYLDCNNPENSDLPPFRRPSQTYADLGLSEHWSEKPAPGIVTRTCKALNALGKGTCFAEAIWNVEVRDEQEKMKLFGLWVGSQTAWNRVATSLTTSLPRAGKFRGVRTKPPTVRL